MVIFAELILNILKSRVFRHLCGIRFMMLSLLIGVVFQIMGQAQEKVSVKFTQWYQNKPGAISFSFDDAGMSQYENAWPALDKYGFKGTFSIVGAWVEDEAADFAEEGFFDIKRMGWKQLLDLYAHGNELSAHGSVHKQYDKFLPVPELAEQMKQIRQLIESKTNARVYTLHYPYSFASGNIPAAAREAGYLFARTGLDTVNPASPGDMYLLASQAILSDQLPDSTTFRNWIGQAKNNWLILMYHHLFTPDSREISILRAHKVDYTYSVSPDIFRWQVSEIADSGYWVAPVCEVGKYITQRDNTQIQTVTGKKRIEISLVSSLDKTIYNQPMTIRVLIPWKEVKVEGGSSDGIYAAGKKPVYIDIVPGQTLILTKK
jgi:peptidoglycan/xylan/chitin deacetylase (PgdA/CDA1 family)